MLRARGSPEVARPIQTPLDLAPTLGPRDLQGLHLWGDTCCVSRYLFLFKNDSVWRISKSRVLRSQFLSSKNHMECCLWKTPGDLYFPRLGREKHYFPLYPSFLPGEGKYIKTHVGGSKYLIIG